MKRYYAGLIVLMIGIVLIVGCKSQEPKPEIVLTLSENKYQTSAGWQEFTDREGTLYSRYCQNGLQDGKVVLFECTPWEFFGGIFVKNP